MKWAVVALLAVVLTLCYRSDRLSAADSAASTYTNSSYNFSMDAPDFDVVKKGAVAPVIFSGPIEGVTCTATAATFEKHRVVFQNCLDSFKLNP